MKMQGTVKQNIFFGIISILDCIALIPSPLLFAVSMMSAAGGAHIYVTAPFELFIRLLWILSAFYPLYIVAAYTLGRSQVIKYNKKRGYVLALVSGAVSLTVIIILLKVFIT